ncbi:aminopeptidase N [Vibrio metschnikovii]|nr:aminopeptidase N [Vibrio metschnikovii]
MATSPLAKYRKDYQAPSHYIDRIDLTFDLHDHATVVTAVSHVEQQADSSTLLLDGEGLVLTSLKINGEEWQHFTKSEAHLEITQLPQQFELTIVTEIDPQSNTALEGLYKSGGAFCTQCEAEGFRRITYFLDRPDVLAKYTSTVIADKALYPYLLSNGNKIAQGEADNGRHWVKWHDPILNQRIYLLWSREILTSCVTSLSLVLVVTLIWKFSLIKAI